tara:strand:+ start:804 stop:1715 length:912 start_codon:yes stop_codon:yes gene_type:complete
MQVGLQDYVVEQTTAEWTLYHNDFSLCSRKVRICLHEAGFNYESKHIDLIETGKYEVASKSFLKINPGATVPVLLNKGRPIYESHEQIKFLFNKMENFKVQEDVTHSIDYWTNKASMVGNPVKEHKKYAGNTIGPLTFPLFTTMLKNVSIIEVVKGLISHPLKERVLIFLLLKIFGFTFLKVQPIQNLIKSAFKDLNNHLLELETELSFSKREWLASEHFSLADISWSVILHRLDECGWSDLLLEKKPFVNAYYEKIKKRDSFQKGIVNQKNPNLEKGIKELKLAIQNNPFLKSFRKELSALN